MMSENTDMILGRVLATNELILKKIDEMKAEYSNQYRELNKRLTEVENKLYYYAGWIAAGTAAFSVAVNFLIRKFT